MTLNGLDNIKGELKTLAAQGDLTWVKMKHAEDRRQKRVINILY